MVSPITAIALAALTCGLTAAPLAIDAASAAQDAATPPAAQISRNSAATDPAVQKADGRTDLQTPAEILAVTGDGQTAYVAAAKSTCIAPRTGCRP